MPVSTLVVHFQLYILYALLRLVITYYEVHNGTKAWCHFLQRQSQFLLLACSLYIFLYSLCPVTPTNPYVVHQFLSKNRLQLL